MGSLELNWADAQIEAADSTEITQDDQEKDSTEITQDDEIRMDAESTDATQDKFLDADSTDETQEKFLDADSTDGTSDKFTAPADARATSKIPASEIVVRTIAVERSAPLAALPVDANVAFSQWLSGSGLAPAKH